MTTDWWPTALAHIPKENPLAHEQVVVAEVQSFDETPHQGQRTMFSLLVPVDQLDFIKASLLSLDHEVSASGPHPSYLKDRPFEPQFWIEARTRPNKKFEPLVLEWRSHHTTVLQPDPGFLMTYGLVPRVGSGGMLFWDDPRSPRRGIVVVSPPSIWSGLVGTHAFVSISREFLRDYLTLRHMALVQVYWELRWAALDSGGEARLGDKEAAEIRLSDKRFLLRRDVSDQSVVSAQVWGARVVAEPGGLPISEDPLDAEGLDWPGIAERVTNDVAMSMGVMDYVYVDDRVLADFEGRPEYRVNPESGSVVHGTQWSVSYCDRVGRNLIRAELKKLYEGAPPHIICHWNKFAVEPIPVSAYPAIADEPNIAKRASELIFGMLDLGDSLAQLAASVGEGKLTAEDFVGLRRSAVRYYGWWSFELTGAIARHAPVTMSADAFLERCMNITKLVVEGLSEKALRRLVAALGIPSKTTANWRTLKLLDCVVRLAQVAVATGIGASKSGEELWKRLNEDGTTPEQPIACFFALYDLRLLEAHRSASLPNKLTQEFARFGVEPGDTAGGYGTALDRVFDQLSARLYEVAEKISSAAAY